MNPTVAAAVISGAAVIIAALIALFSGHRKRHMRRSGTDSNLVGSTKQTTVVAGGDATGNIVDSKNVNVDRSEYYGPVTKINIAKFISPSNGSLIGDTARVGSEIQQLLFVTEREFPYSNHRTGLSLSFTLSNQHSRSIVIHSIRLNLVRFEDKSSPDFTRVIENATPPGRYLSAPISVAGVKIDISPLDRSCRFFWGRWDDSADSRGLVYRASDESAFRKMQELIAQFSKQGSVPDVAGFELLPPTLRFAQQPGETDSFHCQISGKEEGIYFVKFTVGYHVGGEKREISSDKVYGFASIDWMIRRK